MNLRVGELARRSGLTVRTLHHYDSIGLLRPSARSDAGYRLYGRKDIARLHQIQALRGLGVSLADIGAILDRPGLSLPRLVEQQIRLLDRQIAQQRLLRERLAQLHGQFLDGEVPELADWLTTLEMMTMYDRYFSPEELAALPFYQDGATKREEWTALAREAETLMRQSASPRSEAAQALARRWMCALERDTAANPAWLVKLNDMHAHEASLQAQLGITPAIGAFIMTAFAESRLALYERYLSADEMTFMRGHYAQRMQAWPALLADLRQAMDDGMAADSPQARQLAGRWLELLRGYAGDDPETHRKIRLAHEREPTLNEGTWTTPALLAYLAQAVAALQTDAGR